MSEPLGGTYYVVPVEVLADESLTDRTARVLAVIYGYRTMHRGGIFPGRERLAKEAGTNVRSIDRALKEARAAGYIDWKRRGLGKTNVYTILRETKGKTVLEQEKEPQVAIPELPHQTTQGSRVATLDDSGCATLDDSESPHRTTQDAPHQAHKNQEKRIRKGESGGEEKRPPLPETVAAAWGVSTRVDLVVKLLGRAVTDAEGKKAWEDGLWNTARRRKTTIEPRRDFSVAHKAAVPVILKQGVSPEEFSDAVRYHETREINGAVCYAQSWPGFCARMDSIVIARRAGRGTGADGKSTYAGWGGARAAI